jgi:hypothetical protein
MELTNKPSAISRQPSAAPRDLAHEQISASTTAELRDRLRVLRARYEKYGYPLAQLWEMQGISSELFCRDIGRESQPWQRYVVQRLPQPAVALLEEMEDPDTMGDSNKQETLRMGAA